MKEDSIAARLAPFIKPRTQQKVEQAATLSKGWLSKVLSGKIQKPDETMIRAVCAVVGADFEWVYFGRGKATPASQVGWRSYAASRPAFAIEAAFAMAADYADDRVLEAATKILGDVQPSAEEARAAIVAARTGVDTYRSMVPGLPGATWRDVGPKRGST